MTCLLKFVNSNKMSTLLAAADRKTLETLHAHLTYSFWPARHIERQKTCSPPGLHQYLKTRTWSLANIGIIQEIAVYIINISWAIWKLTTKLKHPIHQIVKLMKKREPYTSTLPSPLCWMAGYIWAHLECSFYLKWLDNRQRWIIICNSQRTTRSTGNGSSPRPHERSRTWFVYNNQRRESSLSY